MLALTQFATALGVKVEMVTGPNAMTTGTVYLSDELQECDARAVLAHYLAHRTLGHRPIRRACQFAGHEKAAQELAALYLIAPHRFAEAVKQHGGDDDAIAAVLNVPPTVLTRYRQAVSEGRVLAPLVLEPRHRRVED